MYKLLALSVALLIGFSSLPAAAQNCNLSRSVYRDANGKGFELIFGESVPGQASSRATAVIRQPNMVSCIDSMSLSRMDMAQHFLLIPSDPRMRHVAVSSSIFSIAISLLLAFLGEITLCPSTLLSMD